MARSSASMQSFEFKWINWIWALGLCVLAYSHESFWEQDAPLAIEKYRNFKAEVLGFRTSDAEWVKPGCQDSSSETCVCVIAVISPNEELEDWIRFAAGPEARGWPRDWTIRILNSRLLSSGTFSDLTDNCHRTAWIAQDLAAWMMTDLELKPRDRVFWSTPILSKYSYQESALQANWAKSDRVDDIKEFYLQGYHEHILFEVAESFWRHQLKLRQSRPFDQWLSKISLNDYQVEEWIEKVQDQVVFVRGESDRLSAILDDKTFAGMMTAIPQCGIRPHDECPDQLFSVIGTWFPLQAQP